jgi:tetratricopeptide (TPR) repeat protein
LQMFTIRREQGRLREVTPLIKRFVEGKSSSATWRPGLALIYSDLGMEQEARAEFEHLAAEDFTRLPWDALRPATLAYLSEVCAFLDDGRRAATLYQLMKAYDGQNLVIGFAAACYGAAARFLGILAAVRSDWSQADMHFADALAMNAKMGARPWLAHTQYQYAAVLLARGSRADIARGISLLDEALAAAQALGMHGLTGKIQTLKQAISE